VVLGLLTGNVAGGAAVKLGARRSTSSASASTRSGATPRPPRAAAHRAARRRELLGLELGGDGHRRHRRHAGRRAVRPLGDARTLAVATGRYSVDELAEHAPTAVVRDLTDTDAVVAALLG
jgi:hypothetical protein